MGYTHYWRRPPEISKNAYDRWVTDVRCLVAVFNNPTALVQKEHNDRHAPVIGGNLVRFNGIGDAGHETFMVDRVYKPDSPRDVPDGGMYFEFCKTACKPYDTLVVACLVALKYRVPEARVSSDGGDEEWQAGKDLCQRVLGYGAEAMLSDGLQFPQSLTAQSVA